MPRPSSILTREPRGTSTTERGLEGALVDFLERFEPDPASSSSIAAQKAVALARSLQERAAALQTPQERKQQAELERMMQSPHERATLTQLTDQAFRSESAVRAADQLTHILDVQGVPRFFGAVDRTLLKGFQSFGSYLPGVAVPLVKDKMREETANVILPAERELLSPHLSARRDSGMRMNVNFLGEALLGEEEAEARLESYLEALQFPELEVLSVKISTIYSQISSLAFEDTVAVLCDRLELLYRTAAKMRFTQSNGAVVPKFVYLDMEEYRDLNVTAEAFMQTLDREGLEQAGVGIALQAYLPDSFAVQKKINAWARHRAAAGGAPITVRIAARCPLATRTHRRYLPDGSELSREPCRGTRRSVDDRRESTGSSHTDQVRLRRPGWRSPLPGRVAPDLAWRSRRFPLRRPSLRRPHLLDGSSSAGSSSPLRPPTRGR